MRNCLSWFIRIQQATELPYVQENEDSDPTPANNMWCVLDVKFVVPCTGVYTGQVIIPKYDGKKNNNNVCI